MKRVLTNIIAVIVIAVVFQIVFSVIATYNTFWAKAFGVATCIGLYIITMYYENKNKEIK